MIATARVQKVSADRTGRVVVEVYRGEKSFVVVDVGVPPVEVAERPTKNDVEEAPPAVQGLVRKELQPAMLVPELSAVPPRLVFERPDDKVRVLILEKRRTVVGAVVDGGAVRILAVLGEGTSPGRDLRRGALYCAPVAGVDEGPASGTTRAASESTAASPVKAKDPLAELKARAKAEEKRLKRLVAALEKDLVKHGDPAALETRGELLKPLLGTLKRGLDHVDTVDWEGNPVTLALDPALDAKTNLARLFHKAKKARLGIAHVTPRLAEARTRLAALKGASTALATTTSTATTSTAATVDVGMLEALLRAPETGGSARRRAATATGRRLSWRSFKVTNDVVVRVGRGAKDNDELRKSARGNDLWMHARDQRGAHVIVPESGALTDDVVLDAAHLAAHFSAARGEPRVDIQHTRVKNLKKGPAVGLVLVSNETVVHLRVDDARVQRLLAQEVAAS